jgi:hypothetical protein
MDTVYFVFLLIIAFAVITKCLTKNSDRDWYRQEKIRCKVNDKKERDLTITIAAKTAALNDAANHKGL